MEPSPRRHWLSLSAILFLFSVAFLIFSTSTSLRKSSSTIHISKDHSRLHAPKHNVWAELTAPEITVLFAYLYDQPNELNLTRNPEFTGWENDVRLVQALQPNKSDVVSYLDGSGNAPSRYARILVNERAKPQTRLAEYMIGPLDNHSSISAVPLNYCYNSGRSYVDTPGVSDLDGIRFAMEVASNISDITMDLLDAKLDINSFLDSDSLMLVERLESQSGKGFVSWLEFKRPGTRSGEWSLLPQGLYIKIEGHGREPTGWKAVQWGYNGILYDSEDEFRRAWKSPDFVKLKPSLPGSWSDTEDIKANPPAKSLPPPIMVQPHGPRYLFDAAERYISWMGFTFYLSSSFFTGLALYDIRFDDSRIMYSLELQEAMSHYSGSDPMHGGEYWFDGLFGMGFLQSELIPGYDCPAYATFLNTTYQGGNNRVENKNAICIFEYTADHAISRHSTPFSTSVSRNTYLVVRTAVTVGNYDYTIDFNFFLDGAIEVKYRASGYIMAAFYPPFSHTATNQSQAPDPHAYGYHIHDSISSSIHTHILNFRADLDIAGSANTFVRTKLDPFTTTYAFDQPQHPTRNTMHLTSHPVTTETALNWPANSQELYLIFNNAASNARGEKRACRLMPGTLPGAPAHLAVRNSTSLGASAHWAESDLFVLRAHDHEQASSSPLSYLAPNDPLIDFAKMLDGEPITQEDLVLYFNLGNHHVPTTQDIPNTLMHTSGSAVMFVPFNYFDRDVSRGTVSGVRIDTPLDGKKKIRKFGGHYEEGDGLEPDLSHVGVVHGEASIPDGVQDLQEVVGGPVWAREMLGRGWMRVAGWW